MLCIQIWTQRCIMTWAEIHVQHPKCSQGHTNICFNSNESIWQTLGMTLAEFLIKSWPSWMTLSGKKKRMLERLNDLHKFPNTTEFLDKYIHLTVQFWIQGFPWSLIFFWRFQWYQIIRLLNDKFLLKRAYKWHFLTTRI